jgi:chromosome segregation ATPase
MSHTEECLWSAIGKVADMVTVLQEQGLIVGKQYESAQGAKSQLDKYETELKQISKSIAEYTQTIKQSQETLKRMKTNNDDAKKKGLGLSDTSIVEGNIKHTESAKTAASALKKSLEETIAAMRQYQSTFAKLEKDRQELQKHQSKLDSLETTTEQKEKEYKDVSR